MLSLSVLNTTMTDKPVLVLVSGWWPDDRVCTMKSFQPSMYTECIDCGTKILSGDDSNQCSSCSFRDDMDLIDESFPPTYSTWNPFRSGYGEIDWDYSSERIAKGSNEKRSSRYHQVYCECKECERGYDKKGFRTDHGIKCVCLGCTEEKEQDIEYFTEKPLMKATSDNVEVRPFLTMIRSVDVLVEVWDEEYADEYGTFDETTDENEGSEWDDYLVDDFSV